MMEIRFEKANSLKAKPDVSKIGFGTHFTDYMFEMDYNEKDGWHDPRIVPYRNIEISPANTTLPRRRRSRFRWNFAKRRTET